MKEKIISFYLGKKKVRIKVRVVPKWYEGIGLMFSRRESSRALIFEFKKSVRMPIHSWFVFFPFFAIWINSKNKVVDSKIVKPFSSWVLPSENFKKLIEIPLNSKYKFFQMSSVERKI
ncbi:MAG: DUF192 domain-containing protein [Nanoarchaeota archaeon]|nr:DUF192 domain-containing protein [Nanoarchaeota archaeon]